MLLKTSVVNDFKTIKKLFLNHNYIGIIGHRDEIVQITHAEKNYQYQYVFIPSHEITKTTMLKTRSARTEKNLIVYIIEKLL